MHFVVVPQSLTLFDVFCMYFPVFLLCTTFFSGSLIDCLHVSACWFCLQSLWFFLQANLWVLYRASSSRTSLPLHLLLRNYDLLKELYCLAVSCLSSVLQCAHLLTQSISLVLLGNLGKQLWLKCSVPSTTGKEKISRHHKDKTEPKHI